MPTTPSTAYSAPLADQASHPSQTQQAPTDLRQTAAASRDGFGQGLVQAAQTNPSLVALCADLTRSLRMDQFARQFPNRFIQVGVAEQNLAGVAAGLALAGKISVMGSFAAFSPGRNFDQIRCSIAYSNLPVIIASSHAGLGTGPDGATHQMLSDLAMMRALPNLTIVQPCDALQAKQAIQALIKQAQTRKNQAKQARPAYLRLFRPKVKPITTLKGAQANFSLGKAQIIKQGVDLTIISSGLALQPALAATNQLSEQGYSVRLINLHTLKPLDEQKIIDAVNETQGIITIEDHQIHGGLGSAVAQVMAQNYGQTIRQIKPLKIIAVEDKFGESGDYKKLYQKYGLTAKKIKRVALNILKNK
jgi:transketolase